MGAIGRREALLYGQALSTMLNVVTIRNTREYVEEEVINYDIGTTATFTRSNPDG